MAQHSCYERADFSSTSPPKFKWKWCFQLNLWIILKTFTDKTATSLRAGSGLFLNRLLMNEFQSNQPFPKWIQNILRLNSSCGGWWWWSKFNSLLGHSKLVKLSAKWQPEHVFRFFYFFLLECEPLYLLRLNTQWYQREYEKTACMPRNWSPWLPTTR